MFALLNPFLGLSHMWALPFMRYAIEGGTGIAIASGLVGYFVVLRGQVFVGDALSHVAFTGALAALVSGIDLLFGLYTACIIVALAMAALGTRGHADDAIIGNVFAWILGLGALFLTVYTTSSNGTNATSGVSVLFGSIFGLSSSHAFFDVVLSLVVVAVVVVIGRPLLFASIDEAVAAARGVPVRTLAFAFFALVGVTAAAATQAVGALPLLGLLAAPAGAAQRLTPRPFRALWLSAAISLLSMWVGLSISYADPAIPPSFAIIAMATASYLAAFLATLNGVRFRRSSREWSFSEPSAAHDVDAS